MPSLHSALRSALKYSGGLDSIPVPPPPPVGTFLLDALPGAIFAGGVIRMKGDFSGVAATGTSAWSLSGNYIDAAAGGAITTIHDQGGSGVTFEQSNGPSKPSIVADGTGIKGLRFGAAGATSFVDSSFANLPQPCTIYALTGADASMNQLGRVVDSDSTANYAIVKTNGQWNLYNVNGQIAGKPGGTIGVERVALVLDGANSRLHVGNIVQTFNQAVGFDAKVRYGAASNETQGLDGFIYAMAVYGAAHTVGQVATAYTALTYNNQPALILADGDSIAFGTALTVEEARIHNRIIAKFAADGIACDGFNDGNPSQALLNNTDYTVNILARVVSTRKCMILLNQGTVDLSLGIPAATIFPAFTAYAVAAEQTGAIFIANSIIVADPAVHPAPVEAQRLLLNASIMGSPTPRLKFDFGNLAGFNSQAGLPNANYADTVHPSNAGTLTWVNALYPQLKAVFDTLP